LANTASLLFPVSNLTNLLGINRLGLSTGAFAAQMLLPQLVALALTSYFLWMFHWRSAVADAHRYRVPEVHRPRDIWIFRLGAVCTAAFVALVLLGIPLYVTSLSVAAVMVVAVAVRRPYWLAWCMIPWRLLLFVTGLFLVIQTVSQLGLGDVLSAIVGTDDGAGGVARAAGAGAVLANAINNLPGYIAIEQAIPSGNEHQLFGLLLGANIGPLITPWASLAILLWHERCRAAGVTIQWRKFMITGAVTASVTLAATVTTYVLTM
ncbi:MAG: ArsB/NhaD family transporter, partial [Pseudonocardiaceae bacterium]